MIFGMQICHLATLKCCCSSTGTQIGRHLCCSDDSKLRTYALALACMHFFARNDIGSLFIDLQCV
jgi:hypothetical protein